MLKVVGSEERHGDEAEEFRIAASDTKGHSARMWFRCIPAMARQIEQIVQSKDFPYRTKGDLLRHALHRHMNWLAQKTKTTSVSGQVDVILELMRDEEMNDDFREVFSRVESRMRRYIDEGCKEEATRLLLTVKRHIDLMPESYWKERYKKEVAERYGVMFEGRGGKNANLGVTE